MESIGLVIEYESDRLDRRVAPPDEPLVILLDRSAPASRMSAASFGTMPTPPLLRPISPLTRSSGLVERSFDQCAGGKR